MNCELYRVGGLVFSLTMDSDSPLWRYTSAYKPFLIEELEEGEELLFEVEVVEKLAVPQELEFIVAESEGSVEDGMVKVNVQKTNEGFYFELIPPFSSTPSAKIDYTQNLKKIKVEIIGTPFQQQIGFNNTLVMSYVLNAPRQGAMLLHSSAVLKDGYAYLFLGKSGTGKSTHTRLWQENIPECELLNDDHPIVRVMPNNEVLAFGSPWSGKTHCYKNLKAPLGAIVRLEQAPENQIRKLSIPEAYASIMASSSGMNWYTELNDNKAKILNVLLRQVKNYRLKCLPNGDAALTSYQAIKVE